MYFDQQDYDVRCEWELAGVRALSAAAEVTVIIDVLSFSTCVDIACSRGAVVYPYRYRDETAELFATMRNAQLAAAKRSTSELSLSPASLLKIAKETRLVLPSPNGATLTLACQSKVIFAACLRNYAAVSDQVSTFKGPILVVPSGEQWEDGTLRPSVEDMLGAGAIISRLPGRKSSEALVAEAVFLRYRHELATVIAASSSGQELMERACDEDVRLATEVDVSRTVPILIGESYVAWRAEANTSRQK